MPMEMMAGSGEECRRQLLHYGMAPVLGEVHKNKLGEYLSRFPPSAPRVLCTGRIGWHGSAFVLPDRTYGQTADGRELFLQVEHQVRPFVVRAAWQSGRSTWPVLPVATAA